MLDDGLMESERVPGSGWFKTLTVRA